MLSLESSAVDFVIASRWFKDFAQVKHLKTFPASEAPLSAIRMQNMFSSGSATAEQYLQLSLYYRKSRWTLDWNTTRSVTTASKAGSPSNLRAREWENRHMYVFSSVHLFICLSFRLSVSNDIRYPAGISMLNQRQTSTLYMSGKCFLSLIRP